MSKQQNFIRQQIHQKRGDYTRARKKKYEHLKNTGQYLGYYQNKRGLSMKKVTIRSSTGSGIPPVSQPKKGFASIIKGIFKRKKHAENIL